MTSLRVGQLITAPFLPATAEIKQYEARSGYTLIEVVLRDGHHTYKSLRITDDQLAQVQVLERSPVALTDNAEDFFFLIEAHRIRLAYQFDPQLAVSVSQVDPFPHQIEAVHHNVLNSPRIRFLIADDPGAGKTIMAGLILVEPEPAERRFRETPEPAAIYQVTPAVDTGADAARKAEIEQVGMRVAMQYERDQDWQPEDVSGQNHGFDVRSTLYNPDGTFADIRYIEVKARAQSGGIRLSANEWKKARHSGEKFWLYIVAEATSSAPQLNRIQNPALLFHEGEDIFATGFVIPEEKWKEKGGS